MCLRVELMSFTTDSVLTVHQWTMIESHLKTLSSVQTGVGGPAFVNWAIIGSGLGVSIARSSILAYHSEY